MSIFYRAFLTSLALAFFVTLSKNKVLAQEKVQSATGITIDITIRPGQNDFLTANDIQPYFTIFSGDESKSTFKYVFLCDSSGLGNSCEYFLDGKSIPKSYNVSVRKGETLNIVVQVPIGLASKGLRWSVIDKDPTIPPIGAPAELMYIITGGDHYDDLWSGSGSLEYLIKSRGVYQKVSGKENDQFFSIKAKVTGCKTFDKNELDQQTKLISEQIQVYKAQYKSLRFGMFYEDPNLIPLLKRLDELFILRENNNEIRTGKYPCLTAE